MSELFGTISEFVKENDSAQWLMAIVIAILITVFIKGTLNFILARISRLTKHTRAQIDDLLIYTFLGTQTWIIFVWIFSAFVLSLETSDLTVKAAKFLVTVVSGIQVSFWGLRAIHFWRKNFLAERTKNEPSSIAAIGLLATAVQGLFVIIVLLIVLSNLGIDVAALIAGLGVGGIAVALAAQNILGDLLASLSIVLDKPFVVGDFIVVGTEVGTVENIGIKTTRVRSLSGEELIFSNKDLLESRVRNYKRMWRRRVVQKISVNYSTPAEKLEKIPKWIKTFIEENPNLRFDRCHFAAYGEYSLDFEFVFFVESPEFNSYMDYQQELFLKIYRKFESEKIELALPRQIVKMEPQEALPRS